MRQAPHKSTHSSSTQHPLALHAAYGHLGALLQPLLHVPAGDVHTLECTVCAAELHGVQDFHNVLDLRRRERNLRAISLASREERGRIIATHHVRNAPHERIGYSPTGVAHFVHAGGIVCAGHGDERIRDEQPACFMSVCPHVHRLRLERELPVLVDCTQASREVSADLQCREAAAAIDYLRFGVGQPAVDTRVRVLHVFFGLAGRRRRREAQPLTVLGRDPYLAPEGLGPRRMCGVVVRVRDDNGVQAALGFDLWPLCFSGYSSC